jgi:hypothetical protein
VFGDFGCINFGNVTDELVFLPVGKIGKVRLLSVFVPLAGEQASAADRIETLAQPTNPGKKVDESEVRL